MALLLAVWLVGVAALPAAAQDEGSGTAAVVGYETVFDHEDPATADPDCLLVNEAQYVFDANGTFLGAGVEPGSVGVGSYTGPATVTVDVTEDFYIDPEGTHPTAACGGPAAVPATITVTSPGAGGINCGPTPGTYLRYNFGQFEVEWTGECTVSGVSTGSVAHMIQGDQQPCPPLLSVEECKEAPLLHGEWHFPHTP